MTNEKTKLILVVDDEEEILQTLESFLAHLGYRTVTAASAKSALQIFDQESGIDLILLDVSLPDMNGIEVLRHIQRRPSHPPVVMMTGGAETRVFEAQRAGAVDFLLKPFSTDTLSATIQTSLERGR